MIGEQEDYILYLRTSGCFSAEYFHLSKVLKYLDISLVPVTLEQLMDMRIEKGTLVLNISSNIEELKHFLYYRKRFLDFALKTSAISLVNVSSFSGFKGIEELVSLKNYYHLEIPIDLRIVACELFEILEQSKKHNLRWPGGRRARLPAME